MKCSHCRKDTFVRHDCFDQFNKYLGVTVCYELSHNLFKKGDKLLNNRMFPLNGPAHVSAYVEIDRQYHFKALYDYTNEKGSLELIFDTPESQLNRKVAIKFEAAIKPKIYLSASVESPYKTAHGEIGFNNDDKELTLYAQGNSDAADYLAKFGFKKQGSDTHKEYIPIIEYNRPDAVPYKVSGKVIADSSQAPKIRYTLEKLTIEPVQGDGKFGPLTLDGWFEAEKTEQFATALDIKYKDKSANVKGKLVAKKQEFDLDASILSDVHELANGKLQLYHKHDDKQVNFIAKNSRIKSMDNY